MTAATSFGNVPLVHAVRGQGCGVTAAAEGVLEEIYVFLERLRTSPGGVGRQPNGFGPGAPNGRPQQAPQLALNRKSFTLPEGVRDWFVPKGIKSPSWMCEGTGTDEELQLHRHVITLYRLGIPTFLREPAKHRLIKFHMSVEAYIREVRLPPAADAAATSRFWGDLRLGLLQFVCQSMAVAAKQMFGVDKPCLAAIFNASGYSATAGRWKVSFRIVFFEQVVSMEIAKRLRDIVIHNLEEAWNREPREGWAAALEPIDHDVGGDPAVAAAAPSRFWEQILDGRVLEPRATLRLVYCDTVSHDLGLPEERPLLPHGIFQMDKVGELQEQFSMRSCNTLLEESAWIRLGSIASEATNPTPFWNAVQIQSVPLMLAPAVAAAFVQPAVAAGPAVARDEWIEYFDVQKGQPYFHNPLLQKTVWQLPPGATAHKPQQYAPQQAQFAPQQAQYAPQQPQYAPQQPQQPQYAPQQPFLPQQFLPPQQHAQPSSQWHAAQQQYTQPVSQQQFPPNQWNRYLSPEGQPYYHNPSTDQTEWSMPAGATVVNGWTGS